MYCSFCGNEMPDGVKILQPIALGVASSKAKPKKTFSNKKVVISIVLAAVVLIAACASVIVVSKSPAKAIVGGWERAEGKTLIFSKSGFFVFEQDRLIFESSYTIEDDKTLLIHGSEKTYEFKYGEKYSDVGISNWFIDDNDVLHFNDKRYVKIENKEKVSELLDKKPLFGLP